MVKQKRLTVRLKFNGQRDYLAWVKRLSEAGLDMKLVKRVYPYAGHDALIATCIVSNALPTAYFNSEQLAVLEVNTRDADWAEQSRLNA